MTDKGFVLITGASTGIGAATALYLDTLGFSVLAGVRKDADGEALKARASDRLCPVIIDVTDADSIAAAADEVQGIVGDAGLAGLVNNAGIAVGGPIETVPMDDVRRQFEVNVIGLIAVTRIFTEDLRRARGRIVHMGSIAGRHAAPFLGLYAATKHAVEAITDSMRQELRPWGIHVSVVEPGAIATPIWEKSANQGQETASDLPARAIELYGPSLQAMGRAAAAFEAKARPPEEVAKAVAHALTAPTPKTRYLVGTDAKIQAFLRGWLPDRMMDALARRMMKLPQ
jgi:NAD(P)-dependent dehydrogenase (short-subunit alcohol dehydrogenase family)